MIRRVEECWESLGEATQLFVVTFVVTMLVVGALGVAIGRFPEAVARYQAIMSGMVAASK